jgi:hypothetical protein
MVASLVPSRAARDNRRRASHTRFRSRNRRRSRHGPFSLEAENSCYAQSTHGRATRDATSATERISEPSDRPEVFVLDDDRLSRCRGRRVYPRHLAVHRHRCAVANRGDVCRYRGRYVGIFVREWSLCTGGRLTRVVFGATLDVVDSSHGHVGGRRTPIGTWSKTERKIEV